MADKPNYDLMVLLDPEAPEERRAQLIEQIKGQIESGDAALKGDADWGMRRLAYEIDHRTEAQYHLFQFEASAEVLTSSTAACRSTTPCCASAPSGCPAKRPSRRPRRRRRPRSRVAGAGRGRTAVTAGRPGRPQAVGLRDDAEPEGEAPAEAPATAAVDAPAPAEEPVTAPAAPEATAEHGRDRAGARRERAAARRARIAPTLCLRILLLLPGASISAPSTYTVKSSV